MDLPGDYSRVETRKKDLIKKVVPVIENGFLQLKFINVFSMTDDNNQDKKSIIVNFINHPVVSNPDTPGVSTG